MNRSVYLRNVVFGVEDSLVSTVGLLSGIDLGHVPNSTILFTGVVFIAVEAFSMAVGSFLSEESVEEYEVKENGNKTISKIGMTSAIGGLIMFVSFVVAGFIPLLPYLVSSGSASLVSSIVISLVALGILGYASAKVSKAAPWKSTFRMIILGGSAIVIGALVSMFMKIT
jgi:VIT1/CCC1 family predicted Fe2+/Mn2+ transporter